MDVIIHKNEWYWGRKVTVVIDGGRGLCHVSVEDDDRSVAYLTDVIVHPEVRRNGLGNRLLELAKQRARIMDADKLFLWVYPNTWMQDWYVRHGFKLSHVDDNGNVNMVCDLWND